MTNSNEPTRWTNERLDQLASFIFANAEAIRENAETIRENAEAIRESNQRMTGLEQLVQSNSRAIQALADRIAEIALVQEEAAEERRELREATVRLEGVAEGIANLLSSLDSDRPTILRKLNTIENKVDRLLEQGNSFGDEVQQ